MAYCFFYTSYSVAAAIYYHHNSNNNCCMTHVKLHAALVHISSSPPAQLQPTHRHYLQKLEDVDNVWPACQDEFSDRMRVRHVFSFYEGGTNFMHVFCTFHRPPVHEKTTETTVLLVRSQETARYTQTTPGESPPSTTAPKQRQLRTHHGVSYRPVYVVTLLKTLHGQWTYHWKYCRNPEYI